MSIIRIRRKKVNRSLYGDALLFLVLAACGAFMVLPLVFVVNNAFKPLDEIFLYPPKFFVRQPTFNNFFDLFQIMSNSWVPITRYMFNTFFVTLLGTAGHVVLASAAAYPLAKRDFPGRKLLFTIVVLSLMFSPHVTAIPNYMTMSWIGFINTYWAIIVPAFASSLGLYLMTQYMEKIPDALIEAAQIDGASEYRIFWQIIMPIVKPAWLTLIIFSFQSLWASGNVGKNFIYKEQLKTLDYALGQILQGGIARTGAFAAVSLLMIIVPITIFLISQSSIIQTMSTSGMKD